METTQEKKGMSKGCLVAMIVVGVLGLIIIIGGVTCWYYKDSIAKMAAVTGMNSVKQVVSTGPQDGIDSTSFNALVDSFAVIMDQEELDYEKYGVFMQSIQSLMQDEELSAEELGDVVDAMTTFFPQLEGIYEGGSLDGLLHDDATGMTDSVLSK